MIFKAAWVVPVGAPPIRDGAVEVVGERIGRVGKAGDLNLSPWKGGGRGRVESAPPPSLPLSGGGVEDLGDVILTPGLVNPHTHLELTCYAGMLEPRPFWEWLPGLVKLRAMPGQVEREQRGVYDGAWESLRAGVTCMGDISRRNLHWQVLKPIPIRKVCFVELLTLADDPPRNCEELRAAVAGVEEDVLLTVGVTPHAPYSVPSEQIAAAVRLAAELRRPWCTHWAETREELAFLRGDSAGLPAFVRAILEQCGVRSPGLPAVQYLERCCAGSPPGALAHFNYAAPGDAERLAAAGHVVMYCPRAHRFFGHPAHPFAAMIKAGVTVAIGTDSAAGNENLALLEEAQYLRRNVADAPGAEALFEMVTIKAARALGLDRQIGTLEAGKQADLAAFPCCGACDDPVRELVQQAPRPTGVWVAGRRVV